MIQKILSIELKKISEGDNYTELTHLMPNLIRPFRIGFKPNLLI